jgi:hypothetical protein
MLIEYSLGFTLSFTDGQSTESTSNDDQTSPEFKEIISIVITEEATGIYYDDSDYGIEEDEKSSQKFVQKCVQSLGNKC